MSVEPENINGTVTLDVPLENTLVTVEEKTVSVKVETTGEEKDLNVQDKLNIASSAIDYFNVKVGEMDPVLGKKIKEIIMCANTFIVFMDDSGTIQWATKGHHVYGKKFGVIQNKIAYWEEICNKVFSKSDAYRFKNLLAEGYSRMLDQGDDESANEIVDQTIKHVRKQGEEILRQNYLISSLVTCTLIIISLVVFILNKDWIVNISDASVYSIFLSGFMGGFGAFVSTTIRAKNYNADISISRSIHIIDGAMRIVFGVFAGVIISVGIKSNIIFGFIQDTKNSFIEPFLGIIGGASEVILPNIIKQVEGKTLESEHNSQTPDPAGSKDTPQ